MAERLTAEMMDGGADSVAFMIVVAGPNGADPHAGPSDRPLQPGDLVTIDCGAVHKGYTADITRTFAIGQVEEQLAEIYEVVRQANAAGRAAVRPGVAAQEIDRAARAVIENAGYGQYFTHRTGHGLGIETHEPPYMVEGNELRLEPGMVFTVEPGVYVPGLGGVRIEDDMVVTAEGGESLTTFPREWTRVGLGGTWRVGNTSQPPARSGGRSIGVDPDCGSCALVGRAALPVAHCPDPGQVPLIVVHGPRVGPTRKRRVRMSEKRGFWSRLWSKRPWVQLGFLVLSNSWFTQNVTKAMPCPGLNCYACPLAGLSCPIGSLQHFAGVRQIPYYLLGVLGLIGALGGRVACGWFCPFGWLQEQVLQATGAQSGRCDLASGRPGGCCCSSRWPMLRACGGWWLLGLPGVVLGLYLVAGFVLYAWLGASRLFSLVGLSLLMPFFTLEPWFSKLCPAGMLEGGIPQVLLDADLRALIGPFFWLKMAILVLFLAWMAVTRRPFCRWICPLGAIWSPFNRCSTLQLRVDQEACIRCDRCQKVCPVDIRIYENETDPACVRCMQCVERVSGVVHPRGQSCWRASEIVGA